MAALAVSFEAAAEARATEGLRLRLARKREEAARLHEQLQRARLDAQQLRLCLQAVGVVDPSFVPAKVRAGSGPPEPPQLPELRSLLQWLAESVDLGQHVVFDCGGEVQVSGRRVLLQRMAAWQLLDGGPLSGSGNSTTRLKLSVPIELQAAISGMLLAARERGGRVEEAVVHRLAESWEMVGTEVVSGAMGSPEPAVFLVHRASAQAITVTRWPSVDFAKGPAASGSFDPERLFARLAAAEAPEPAMPYKARALLEPGAAGGPAELERQGRCSPASSQSHAQAAAPPLAGPARPAPEAPPRGLGHHARARSTG